MWWISSNWCVEKYIVPKLHSKQILRAWSKKWKTVCFFTLSSILVEWQFFGYACLTRKRVQHSVQNRSLFCTENLALWNRFQRILVDCKTRQPISWCGWVDWNILDVDLEQTLDAAVSLSANFGLLWPQHVHCCCTGASQ